MTKTLAGQAAATTTVKTLKAIDSVSPFKPWTQ